MRKITLFLAVLMVLPAAAAITLSPNMQDTYIRESTSSTNYQSATSLYVGLDATSKPMRMIFWPNLTDIPPGATVQDASLAVYAVSDPDDDQVVSAYRISQNMTIGQTTWNLSQTGVNWTAIGGTYSGWITNTTIGANGYYQFNLTSFVQAVVDNNYSNYGILFIGFEASGADNKAIRSLEYSTVAQRPNLTVEYVPNVAPTINSHNASPQKVDVSFQVNLTLNWSDSDSSLARGYFCSGGSFNSSAGCLNKTYCNTSNSASNPIICSYTALQNDTSILQYYAFVCDDTDACSNSTGNFSINHAPNVSVIRPNGDEILNQDLYGSYNVNISVNDTDNDSVLLSIYYSTVQGARQNFLATLNSSDNCTASICIYSFNTSGIGGVYYIDARANDTRLASTDSSDDAFNITTVTDASPPSITGEVIEGNLTAGETATANASIVDGNLLNAWFEVNDSSGIFSRSNMTFVSGSTYSAIFQAGSSGQYKFKVFANDSFGNTNYTRDWIDFNVSNPSASVVSESSPENALQGSIILVKASLNATDPIMGTYAFLNCGSGFTFLNGYPQNTSMGNLSQGVSIAEFAVFTPAANGVYVFNVTFTDSYGNSWNSSNFDTEVVSSIGSDNIFLTATAGASYYLYDNVTIFARLEDEDGNSLAGQDVNISIKYPDGTYWVNETAMSDAGLGYYNYTRQLNSSQTGSYIVLIRASSQNQLRIAYTSFAGLQRGVLIDIDAYPEILAGSAFGADILVTNDLGVYIEVDDLKMSLYDSAGNAVTESVSYSSHPSVGHYSYNYTTIASQPQGNWKVKANATVDGNHYTDEQYWKLTGGPFDVRDISVTDSSVPSLAISVVLENTGSAGQDMTVVWNLTRTDTGEVLDSGSDTRLVPAASEVTYTINPTTSYAGEVKVTFLGYYSGTEKAGAYETFSTTEEASSPSAPSGGGGGGGGGARRPSAQNATIVEPLLIFIHAPDVTVSPGGSVIALVEIKNTGTEPILNAFLTIEDIDKRFISSISPEASLLPKKSHTYLVNFTAGIDDPSRQSIFSYAIKSGKFIFSKKAKFTISEKPTLPGLGLLKEEVGQIKEQLVQLTGFLEKHIQEARVITTVTLGLIALLGIVLFALNFGKITNLIEEHRQRKFARIRKMATIQEPENCNIAELAKNRQDILAEIENLKNLLK